MLLAARGITVTVTLSQSRFHTLVVRFRDNLDTTLNVVPREIGNTNSGTQIVEQRINSEV